jgi:hypothetical protein
VFIGHINLSVTFDGACEHFVHLIESLQQHNTRQYILVRNSELAKRLDCVAGVTVGPAVRSPVSAYCLMPAVDVVHIHDASGWPAGLLLTLTRSTPFTLTRHASETTAGNPLAQAALKRASGFIDENQLDALDHLQVYRRALDSFRVPNMLL